MEHTVVASLVAVEHIVVVERTVAVAVEHTAVERHSLGQRLDYRCFHRSWQLWRRSGVG